MNIDSASEAHRGVPWLVAATAILVTACATSDFGPGREVRPIEDGPSRFMVGSFAGEEIREPAAGEGCRSPMLDPRDGTRLQLVRSSRDRGDYELPAGRYGAREHELLRLDCSTGEVIGLVTR